MGCRTAWGAWRPGCCPSGGRAFSNDRSGTETASPAPTGAKRRQERVGSFRDSYGILKRTPQGRALHRTHYVGLLSGRLYEGLEQM